MPRQKFNQQYLIQFFTMILIVSLSYLAVLQLYNAQKVQQNLSKEQIVQEAKAHFKSIQDTRLWNAQFGGVYVKTNGTLKPNPYLKNNMIHLNKKESMIKINPAWMTRQISDISNKKGSYYFKITSLKPLNPANKADFFEKEALNFFEKNKEHPYYYNFDDQENKFNFMGALTVNKACMSCHQQQGYKVGDIRGGIRVTIPLAIYHKQMLSLENKTTNSVLKTLLVAFIILFTILRLIQLFYKRQYEIENMNEILESKVKKRTVELQQLASHEQHLKEVLTAVTEVNEVLIYSTSALSILKNSTKKLSENNLYPLVITALVKGDILKIICRSKIHNDILNKNNYSLTDNTDTVLNTIQSAVQTKHFMIKKIDYDHLNWLVVLPLMHGKMHKVYAVTVLFCSRKEDFTAEEARILKNMAQNLSIALYSHKQRDAILSVEKEKTADYEETILAFVNIIEQRETYMAGHTIRVAEYCALIAKEMGLAQKEIRRLKKAAILHDIGKVATPDSILLKPGKLSHSEYELIKQHPEVGAQMLERIVMYKDLAQIIRYHHSRYDGKGYPRTSHPDEIPMLSHIMSLADTFDAMTSSRIYKTKKSTEQALLEIKQQSGVQFHPKVVKAALMVLKSAHTSETAQLSSSKLEQRRMAYFFQDALTGMYNEDYLQTILNDSKHNYRFINLLCMHNFSTYNQKHGWKKSNELLQDFAQLLESLYPDSLIIHFREDNFILLDTVNLDINISQLSTVPLFEEAEITLDVRHYKIDNSFTYELFLKEEQK